MPQHSELWSPLLVKRRLSVDEVLQNWAGEFGRAQLLHFTLVSLAWILYALLAIIMVFADRTPQWVCTTASHNGSSLLSTNYAHPLDSPRISGSALCNSSSSICSLDPSLWQWVGGKHQSTVSQWGLICEQSYKVGLAQSLFFTGALLGAGIYGSLSDSLLGRRGVMVLACCLSSLCGLLTAFSPNYWVYLVLRVATGFNCGGMGLASFLLATEPIGPSQRGPAGMSTFYFFSGGIVLLSALAYFTPSWRHLYLITSPPCILYCLVVLPFLSESPRWYLARGRAEDALAILKNIAAKNGRIIASEIILDTEQESTPSQIEQTYPNQPPDPCKIEQANAATLIDIFRIPTTRRRMMIMLVVWLSTALTYYGINLNVPNVGSNLYLGIALNAIAEMPAFAITAILLKKIGRRTMLSYFMLWTGACSIAGALISTLSHDMSTSTESNVRLACGVMAIFGMAATYNLVYIYTAELFPTVVRNAAMGMATQAGQVGAIAAPMIALLGRVHQWLPFGVFTVACVVGALLALKLPETHNRPMYETMEGMLRAESAGENTAEI